MGLSTDSSEPKIEQFRAHQSFRLRNRISGEFRLKKIKKVQNFI